MKITRIEIRKLKLPLIRSFTMSYGEMKHKDTVIFSLHTSDGLIGYGESSSFSSPEYTSETNDTCMYIQENFIAPQIIGRSFETIDEFREAYRFILGNQMAKTGPECAFWHLLSQRDNVSLKSLFGGTRTEIPVGESIGIKTSIEESIDEISLRLREGYLRIKVKIEPGWDTQILAAIRNEWPAIHLSADANSGYHYDDHSATLQQLDEFKLDMLEQPFGADNLVDHAKLQNKISTPICLDESIENAEDFDTALELKACRIVNIKPVRVGGIAECLKIHDAAIANSIGMFCGGAFESGIGRAFNIALASKPSFTQPADMSPAQLYYAEDLIDPSYTIKSNGHINVPDKPGLGFDIQADRIEKYTVKKIVIR